MKVKLDRKEESNNSSLPFVNTDQINSVKIHTNSSLESENLINFAKFIEPAKMFDNIYHHAISGRYARESFKPEKNSAYFFVGWINEENQRSIEDLEITLDDCHSSVNKRKLSTLMSGWGDVNNNFIMPTINNHMIKITILREESQLNDCDNPANQKTVLGYYFPEINVFIGRDYPHCEDGIEYFDKCLMKTLSKIVKKIGEKKVSEKFVEKYPVSQFTFGADPEFLFWERKNKMSVSAYDILSTGDNDLYSPKCKIGVDGHNSTGELRPPAAKSFVGLYSNIKNLLEKINSKYSSYDVDLMGESDPIGFHFHFGHHYFKNYNNIKNFVKVLDYYFGSKFIDTNSDKRKNSGYERLGNFEDKNYGFEYRTLPAIIFHDPEIFRIISKGINKLVVKFLKGQEIEITGHEATKGEFLTIMTEEEYEKMNSFISVMSRKENRLKEQGKTLEYWCKERKYKPSFDIEFSDDEFSDSIMTLIYSNKLKNLGDFYFYGINNSKGDFAIAHNFSGEISNYNNIVSQMSSKYKDKKMIGLPYRLRVDSDYKRNLRDLLNKIYDLAVAEGYKQVEK